MKSQRGNFNWPKSIPYFRVIAAMAMLITGFLISGCSFGFGKAKETKYYLLDYVPSPTKERIEKGPYPFVVRMREPSISEAYRRTQIVYRQSIHQMEFYGYHLWAVDPDRMIADLTMKHLKVARIVEAVTRSSEGLTPDFVLQCDIQAIEEYDAQDTWYAHLAMEYQLEDQRNGQIVFKRAYDFRKKVGHQEPIFVVREMSGLLESINTKMIADLEITLDEAQTKLKQDKLDSLAVPTTSGSQPSK